MSTNGTGTPRMMRNIFGIIMIMIYIGMGILFYINLFCFSAGWDWFRWVGGSLFIAYGIWRAYRQFKGVDDPYGDRDN